MIGLGEPGARFSILGHPTSSDELIHPGEAFLVLSGQWVWPTMWASGFWDSSLQCTLVVTGPLEVILIPGDFTLLSRHVVLGNDSSSCLLIQFRTLFKMLVFSIVREGYWMVSINLRMLTSRFLLIIDQKMSWIFTGESTVHYISVQCFALPPGIYQGLHSHCILGSFQRCKTPLYLESWLVLSRTCKELFTQKEPRSGNW